MTLSSRGRLVLLVVALGLAFGAAFAVSRASAGASHAAMPKPLNLQAPRVSVELPSLPTAPPALRLKPHQSTAPAPAAPSSTPTVTPAAPSSSPPPSGGGSGGPVVVG